MQDGGSPATGKQRRSSRDAGSAKAGVRVRLLVILAIALAVRAAALWLARDAHPILDEADYLMRAHALLDGRGFVGSFQSWVRHPGSPLLADLPQYPGAYQAPGYPAFLALVMALTGRSIIAVKMVQVVLSAVTVLFVFRIGQTWYGTRQGLWAALVCALYPNLIAFSHYLWAETVFTFLLLAALSIWVARPKQDLPTWPACIGAGVLFGAAALTRAIALYLLPIVIGWLLMVHRRHLPKLVARVAVAVLIVGLIIAPWTYRNYRQLGGLVLIDTSGAFNLWRGNTPISYTQRPAPPQMSYPPPFQLLPLAPPHEVWALQLVSLAKERYGAAPADLQISQLASQLAWQCIRNDPGAFITRATYKLLDTWNPTSFLTRHFWFKAYGPVSPRVASVITWLAILTYGLVMVLGLTGACLSARNPCTGLLIAIIVFFAGVHAVVIGLTRFRIPVMPLIILLAVVAAGRLLSRRRPPAPGSAARSHAHNGTAATAP